MKKKLLLIILLLIPAQGLFAFGGFGLQVIQDQGMVGSKTFPGDVTSVVLKRGEVSNPLGVAGYVYLDFIPFVDLEADFQAVGKDYTVNFSNALSSKPLNSKFAWARGSMYFTAKKRLFKVGVPFLANVKLHAGGGYNVHYYTPMADMDMIKNLLGGDLTSSFDAQTLSSKLTKYLDNNKKQTSGFHVQAGVQFKLLVLDSQVFYRYTMIKDVYPGQNGFGSLNIRLGIAI
ncbi:MAG: hypothetical protein ACE5D2_04815 [Fidelibacterota bacterium]